jgi:hypothetical protein
MEYIRASIIGKDLYLRAFYPYKDYADVEDKNYLLRISKGLLQEYIEDIKSMVKSNYNISISDVHYNADKDLLSAGVY